MLSRKVLFFVIIPCILLLLANCSQPEPEIKPAAREIIQTVSAQNTDSTVREKSCTLLGCTSELKVELTRQQGDDFILAVGTTKEPDVIFHCFQDRSRLFPLAYTELKLDDSGDLAELLTYSQAPNFCGSLQTGTARISRGFESGALAEIVVFCNDQLSTISRSGSACDHQAITLVDYTPDKVNISVYYNDQQNSVTVQPVYHTFAPNGNDCGPICQSGTVKIDIP